MSGYLIYAPVCLLERMYKLISFPRNENTERFPQFADFTKTRLDNRDRTDFKMFK